VARSPGSFEGRKLGIFATSGADAKMFKTLVSAVEKAGGVAELVAPKIAGITLSDGTEVAAKQKIDGGPSVLFDAVAILTSEEGVQLLMKDAPSQDFVRDAFAHCKYIAFTSEAKPLLEKCGLTDNNRDEGCIELTPTNAAGFVKACGNLRVWDREATVDLDA
jgi:catalase